jgi:hypothetical protein
VNGGNNNDFIFGPLPDNRSKGTPVPSRSSSRINHPATDQILEEIFIHGRGDKTVKPRSFLPGNIKVDENLISSIPINLISNTVGSAHVIKHGHEHKHDEYVIKHGHKHDEQVIKHGHEHEHEHVIKFNNLENSVFQPSPTPKSGPVDFNSVSSTNSHTYTLTTPSSTVFVQRSFGTPDATSQPFKRETLKEKNENPNDITTLSDEKLEENSVFPQEDGGEAIYNSLKEAVDVLTRSSLGFMYVPSNEHIALPGQVVELEDDIINLQQEIESLQKDIEGLDKVNISANNEENIDEVLSLKNNLDDLVQNFEHFPVQDMYEHQELMPRRFGNFPVENIYDKETIEKLLVDINEKNNRQENAITYDNSENEIIESEQLEDILLANYLVSSQHTNVPISLVKEADYKPDTNGFHIHENKANLKHRKKAEIINGTPLSNSVEQVTNKTPQVPRAERHVMIPEAVSNFFTSITSSISYFDGADPPSASQGRAFGNTKPEVNNVVGDNEDDADKPESKETLKSDTNRILIPFNETVYIPVETEKIEAVNAPGRNNLQLGRTNDYEFMKYMNPPAFPTKTSDEDSSGEPDDLVDLIAVESEVENKTSEYEEDHNKAFSIWPESTINTTYQENWIGLHVSPVEVERKKRQLERKKSEDVSRQKRQADTFGEMVGLDENQRNRRQTTDPDQLCPTVASFVMPRAGVNAKGDWMFIVNMPEETQYQQLVRSEICISDNCRGLCGVPPGLSTKCSQQFVQKKLIALDPSGEKLVEDVFWFPSCCVCQITQE